MFCVVCFQFPNVRLFHAIQFLHKKEEKPKWTHFSIVDDVDVVDIIKEKQIVCSSCLLACLHPAYWLLSWCFVPWEHRQKPIFNFSAQKNENKTHENLYFHPCNNLVFHWALSIVHVNHVYDVVSIWMFQAILLNCIWKNYSNVEILGKQLNKFYVKWKGCPSICSLKACMGGKNLDLVCMENGNVRGKSKQ